MHDGRLRPSIAYLLTSAVRTAASACSVRATSASVATRWMEQTGIPILEGYGLTETSPVVSINRFDVSQHNGSVGLPVPGTEIDIIDEGGHSQVLGEKGELCVRGPQVMQGYWQDPNETAAAMDGDGWFYTGDVARLDENGHIYLVDRKKEMVLVQP